MNIIKKLPIALALILVVVGLVISFLKLRASESPLIILDTPSEVEIVLGSSTIQALIADTEASRDLGLSGQESLASSTGLLFIFDKENKWEIWMKDMKFSIDVIWFDKDGVIVGIVPNMSPESYPKVFTPERKALYVLEVPTGTVKNSGIKIGETVEITRS